MQSAVIEFARNVCNLHQANSTEIDPACEHPVICLMEEQKEIEDKGATMRLGAWDCKLEKGTQTYRSYGQVDIRERHRHRYEFNNNYRQQLEEAGLVFAGTTPDGELVEIVEIADHPWFVATQFHPEFKSQPFAPHPLFRDFVGASIKQRVQQKKASKES
jgi:CTP synthase